MGLTVAEGASGPASSFAGWAMRTIVTVFVALLALLAVFAGMAAMAFVRLQRLHSDALKTVAAAPPPAAPTPVVNPPEPHDWAIPAAGPLPGDTTARHPEPAAVALAPAAPEAAALPPLPKATIVLRPMEATVRGREIRVELENGSAHVAGWRDAEASVSWDVGPRRQGRYTVELSLACGDNAGGVFEVSAGNQQIGARTRPTGGPRAFETVAVGAISLPPEGGTLTLRGRERTGEELMNVREVRLIPLP